MFGNKKTHSQEDAFPCNYSEFLQACDLFRKFDGIKKIARILNISQYSLYGVAFETEMQTLFL